MCRIRAALAHEPINKVGEGWLRIIRNVAYNEKLTLFLHWYVQQLMGNQNVPIRMWNINNHRCMTNSAAEGWNSKLNSIRRKRRTTAFLKIHKLKEEVELVSWQLKSRDLASLAKKRRKDICNTRLDN